MPRSGGLRRSCLTSLLDSSRPSLGWKAVGNRKQLFHEDQLTSTGRLHRTLWGFLVVGMSLAVVIASGVLSMQVDGLSADTDRKPSTHAVISYATFHETSGANHAAAFLTGFPTPLLAYPGIPGNGGNGPQTDAVDQYEKKITAQRYQLVSEERKAVLLGRWGMAEPEFYAKLAELQKQYDQHVVLKKFENATAEGRLMDALREYLKWERYQAIMGVESDPEIAAEIKKAAPSMMEVAQDGYANAVKGCNSSNATDNSQQILGWERTTQLMGVEDAFPNGNNDFLDCAKQAPLFLEFDCDVDGPLSFGRVEATGVKLSYDPTGPGFTYLAKDAHLEYVSYKRHTRLPLCDHGMGVSGTMDVRATLFGPLDLEKRAVLQIFPIVRENVTAALKLHHGRCEDKVSYQTDAFWLGFVLTGGTGPFVTNIDTMQTLNPPPTKFKGLTYTRKSDVTLTR